ncbi:hypothetical protein C8R44DRAFT_726561 [Mycena epipterygia]|nr:hypothetical protein C8R44DRAFT_726561 [Mycena epipterygia]
MQEAFRQPEKWNSDWKKITQTVDRVSPSDLVQQSVPPPDLADGKHVLIGLTNVCSIAKNLHDARIYCGRELRLSHLRKDGRAVLDLLKSVMVEDVKIPEKPTYIPDPTWNGFVDAQQRSALNDSEKFALAKILVLRTKLICHFLRCTIRSFVGLELPKIMVKKQLKKKAPEASPSQEFTKALVEQAFPLAPGLRRKIMERSPEHAPGVLFLCWMRQHQTADWKIHHKAICGKPLSFDVVSKRVVVPPAPAPIPTSRKPTVPSASVIGPPNPVGNYKRSHALAYQITNLNHLSKIDYIIMDAVDDPIGIVL